MYNIVNRKMKMVPKFAISVWSYEKYLQEWNNRNKDEAQQNTLKFLQSDCKNFKVFCCALSLFILFHSCKYSLDIMQSSQAM